MTTVTVGTLSELEGYHLVDALSQDVGEIHGVWVDDVTHEPIFVAVKVGLAIGRSHLVPLAGATIDRQQRVVNVPYFQDTMRETRHISPGTELSDSDVFELMDDYNLLPPPPATGA